MVKDYKASRGGRWIGDQGDDGNIVDVIMEKENHEEEGIVCDDGRISRRGK